MHRFIAIEGPIGVGKTTLSRKLSDALDAEFFPDTDDVNPYLDSFYKTPELSALQTQLHFLASRLARLDEIARVSRSKACVSDFLVGKDRLFAELTLNESDWWIYEQLHNRLDLTATAPELTIYLQAPVEILIQRIERRGLRRERRIDSRYLARIVDSYERFFHEYDEAPLLIVNAESINIADNSADFERLQRQIADITAGRHYFNPQPAAVDG